MGIRYTTLRRGSLNHFEEISLGDDEFGLCNLEVVCNLERMIRRVAAGYMSARANDPQPQEWIHDLKSVSCFFDAFRSPHSITYIIK